MLGEEEVTNKWGVPPAQIGDVLAISGDAVDNIAGVGIGRKAAAKLLREFGSIDALMGGLDRVTAQKTREKLELARDRIQQNRKMVELDCDLPLPVPIDDLRIQPGLPATDRSDGTV